ncbi:alpha-N-arabinofuranosidase [Saliterribacillus persicus]|uniref:Alpha-N-arabinofuranosidase n=1 Tax=Saliterribacillus persicus TaxID=930114 RepID=A0A368Y999_9BACI|nr:glycoside hydrolase family 43 protein [Saliterribacillus persicus]RCW74764.1 alpha-N-arabinofuranosidase [Saliterribacillus persicus]
MKYNNPILSGFYPDPSICKVEDTYYLVTSSFEYFPGVPIFKSKDLVNWMQIGHCLTRKSQINLEKAGSSLGIFAPTLRYHDGKFYLITTNVSGGGNFIVWTEEPEGDWSDPIWLKEWPGIDPSLFFDDNGDVYITGNSDAEGGEEPGIYQAKLNLETGNIIEERKFIWSGTGGAHPEGPHLYKINNWYYLMISEGGTEYGHMVTIARSKNPFGPFESAPYNPILTHRSLDHPIQATGHADLIQYGDGTWWAVFLGIRPIGYPQKHHLGRETFLAPVKWDTEGWPIIGDNGVISTKMNAPSNAETLVSPVLFYDDFSETTLNNKWNFLRNPHQKDISLNEKKGYLVLKGSDITLNETDSPSFIGMRQQHFECAVTTELNFRPENDLEEAGMTVIMNESFHYEIAMVQINKNLKLILRKSLSDVSVIEKEIECSGQCMQLRISANENNYSFYYRESDNLDFRLLGTGDCGMLSKEVAGGFTGVYFGLYATGNGKKSTSKAYYNWFRYES